MIKMDRPYTEEIDIDDGGTVLYAEALSENEGVEEGVEANRYEIIMEESRQFSEAMISEYSESEGRVVDVEKGYGPFKWRVRYVVYELMDVNDRYLYLREGDKVNLLKRIMRDLLNEEVEVKKRGSVYDVLIKV